MDILCIYRYLITLNKFVFIRNETNIGTHITSTTSPSTRSTANNTFSKSVVSPVAQGRAVAAVVSTVGGVTVAGVRRWVSVAVAGAIAVAKAAAVARVAAVGGFRVRVGLGQSHSEQSEKNNLETKIKKKYSEVKINLT